MMSSVVYVRMTVAEYVCAYMCVSKSVVSMQRILRIGTMAVVTIAVRAVCFLHDLTAYINRMPANLTG